MKRKILITGAAGYLGSMLVQTLKDDYDVRAIDNFSHGTVKQVGDVKVEKMDITEPYDADNMMRDIHTLIHMAGLSGITPCECQPDNAVQSNLVGLKYLIEEGAHSCLKKIIFPSSMVVYGNPPPKVSEDTPRKPISFYGILKVAAEDLLIAAKERHGIDYLIFRQSNIFGLGLCEKYSLINASIRKALAGEPLMQYGDGQQMRDFIHLRHVMEVYKLALKEGLSGIYNLGSGLSLSIQEVLRDIRSAVYQQTSRKCEIHQEPASSWQVSSEFDFDTSILWNALDIYPVFADIGIAVAEFVKEPACT